MRFEIGTVCTITGGLPWKFLNFNGILRRLHLITQANSQVCLKWMSKCVTQIALREFGVIPLVKYCRRKWVTNLSFCVTLWLNVSYNCRVNLLQILHLYIHPKTYPSFLNYFSAASFAIALKVSFSGRKRIFLFMESVQISPCGFVCEREES